MSNFSTVKTAKTLIAVPTTGIMIPAMVNDLVAMLTRSLQWNGYHCVDNCAIHAARNGAVKRMLETGCDGILFIDSDQTFPAYALDRLIMSGKDIIGYPIVKKNPPYHPNIGKVNEKTRESEVFDGYPQDQIFQVDYIGMGFTYIRRCVFEKMSLPYFDFSWVVDKKNKHGEALIGEDVFFCRKAKKAGFSVWADSTVQVGHVGNFNFMPSLHFNYNEISKMKRRDANES